LCWPSDSVTNATNNTSTVGTAVPQRQCVFANSSNNIDQTYWALVNSSDCIPTKCPAKTFAETSRTGVTSVPETTYSTTSVANNTKNINCSSATQQFGSTLPTVACQSNGTWSAITNDSACKPGCSVSYEGNELDAKGCSDGEWWSIPALSMRHGEAVSFNAHSTCDGDCVSWRYGAVCNDGTLSKTSVVSWAYGDRQGGCQSWDYVPASNSFTGPVNGVHADTYDRADLNYIDTSNVPRTVTLSTWDD
jgi:hypothetical protein